MHQPMLGTFHTEPVVRSEDSELIQQVLPTSWSPCQFRRPEMQNKCCYCESITSDPTSKTRLDGGAFTSRLNGSIISFVGDSLVRQLFYMLVCLLSSHVDQHSSFPSRAFRTGLATAWRASTTTAALLCATQPLMLLSFCRTSGILGASRGTREIIRSFAMHR